MTVLLNKTPHDPLVFVNDAGERLVLPAVAPVRLAESHSTAMDLLVAPDGVGMGEHQTVAPVVVPCVTVEYTCTDCLPPQQPDTVLIVSQLVVGAFPDRPDLMYPTGLVRDDQGTIVGFRALARPMA